MNNYSPLRSRKVCSAVLVLCVFLALIFSSGGTKNPAVFDTVPDPGKTAPDGPVTQQEPGASMIEMVLVSGGTFSMGFPAANSSSFTGEIASAPWPQHNVTLRDFYIGKYEVTQGQDYEVTGSRSMEISRNPDNPTRDGWKTLPVEYATWYHTLVFCNELSIKENLKPVYSIDGSVNPDDWGPPQEDGLRHGTR